MVAILVLLSLVSYTYAFEYPRCQNADARCPTVKGDEPTTIFDMTQNKILCFWSESLHFEVGNVEIPGAQPIVYQVWQKAVYPAALPSYIQKELHQDSTHFICEGSECCFDDQSDAETIREIERLESTLLRSGRPVQMTPPAGDLQTGFGKYNVTGFVCGADKAEVLVWYPFHLNKDGGPWPFIVFGHGLGSGIARDLCKSIASLGFVVVAPKDFQQYCPTSIDDLHTIEYSKANTQLHKALPHVDWSGTGIVGHSMGGNQAVAAATKVGYPNEYNLKAIVASHGVNNPEGMKIPGFFETSIYDRNISPQKVKSAFEACPSRPKVFVNAADGGHMEPTKEAYANPYMAHFFGCHVGGYDKSCQIVYGDGPDSMCADKNLAECIIVKD